MFDSVIIESIFTESFIDFLDKANTRENSNNYLNEYLI